MGEWGKGLAIKKIFFPLHHQGSPGLAILNPVIREGFTEEVTSA